MKNIYTKYINFKFIIFLLSLLISSSVFACSTFMLHKGNQLIYGHNLNEGDIGVPGLVFINKRGVFKMGRTWSELITKERKNPSSHTWISRFGSVTFNNFARDLPDGGMNEVGLYIMEMNEDADFPKDNNLPKLNMMTWMQYILDNYSTTNEAIKASREIEIDGWSWHFFVGDKDGNVASIAFIDNTVVVHKNDDMPVPALFNTPYKRELELLKYYKGFGGLYDVDIDDENVPRFVKAAKMIKEYTPVRNYIDHGFNMLSNLKVSDEPEWSSIYDAKESKVYYRTRISPDIKSISMNNIDFSNLNPTMIINMDANVSGNVIDNFQPYTKAAMKDFIQTQIVPLLPSAFFTSGGLTINEYSERMSSHSDAAGLEKNQIFKGKWMGDASKSTTKKSININFTSKGDSVFGDINFSSVGKPELIYKAEQIHMIGKNLKFSYKTQSNTFIEVQISLNKDKMKVHIHGIEDYYGSYELKKIK